MILKVFGRREGVPPAPLRQLFSVSRSDVRVGRCIDWTAATENGAPVSTCDLSFGVSHVRPSSWCSTSSPGIWAPGESAAGLAFASGQGGTAAEKEEASLRPEKACTVGSSEARRGLQTSMEHLARQLPAVPVQLRECSTPFSAVIAPAASTARAGLAPR